MPTRFASKKGIMMLGGDDGGWRWQLAVVQALDSGSEQGGNGQQPAQDCLQRCLEEEAQIYYKGTPLPRVWSAHDRSPSNGNHTAPFCAILWLQIPLPSGWLLPANICTLFLCTGALQAFANRVPWTGEQSGHKPSWGMCYVPTSTPSGLFACYIDVRLLTRWWGW
jgi:hypothetical protein